MRGHFIPTKRLFKKKDKHWSEGGEVRILLYFWWECKMVQVFWKTVCQLSKTLNRIFIWHISSTPRYLPREMTTQAHTKTCMWIFIAALFIIAKKGKQHFGCQLTDECINKIWHIHIIEYYSAIKSNKILTHDTTWMNFKSMLSGTHIVYNFTFMKCPKKANLYR